MVSAIEEPSAELRDIVTSDQAWHFRVIPKEMSNGQVVLMTDRKDAEHSRPELELLLGKRVILVGSPRSEIERALSSYYRRTVVGAKRVDISATSPEGMLQGLIEEAQALGSSDIHLEIYEGAGRVRVRIDGALVERYRYDVSDHPGLVNRVKVQAGMDISEKRLPQDGRMKLGSGTSKTDLRVSVLPTLFGEKVVLRLLGQDAGELRLDDLGMDDRQLKDYLEGVHRPHGMVLISGPTGSGKTTTLYATLKRLNQVRRNIMTVEDPVEYTLEGINQVHLRENIGLGFSQALRSFLRQDPDVIMLGEIRDPETAQMATRAALTGHLVLSTIHTNSAWHTIARLMDMGVPAYLLAGTLNTSVAQRLIRTLCASCKRPSTMDATHQHRLRLAGTIEQHWVPVGCKACHYTGYKGRRAIYEVITMDNDLIDGLKEERTDVGKMLGQKGVRTLAEGALQHLKMGATSLDEVYPLLTNN